MEKSRSLKNVQVNRSSLLLTNIVKKRHPTLFLLKFYGGIVYLSQNDHSSCNKIK